MISYRCVNEYILREQEGLRAPYLMFAQTQCACLLPPTRRMFQLRYYDLYFFVKRIRRDLRVKALVSEYSST